MYDSVHDDFMVYKFVSTYRSFDCHLISSLPLTQETRELINWYVQCTYIFHQSPLLMFLT